MKRGYITLTDLIAIIQAGDDGEARYAVYNTYRDTPLEPDERVFVSTPVTGDETGKDVFPDDVRREDLWILCSHALIRDVVDNAVHQKRGVTAAEIVCALDHYMEADCFMDLDTDETPTRFGGSVAI